MHLNRETIIDTALQLLDDYGLADMTMRRVATTLGVAPGALYWHIANKQALIAAIAEAIVAPIDGETPTALALDLRRCLLAHRDGAEVTSAGLSQPGNATWERLVDRFVAAVRATSSAPEEELLAGAHAIIYLVLGSATMEQARTQLAEATGASEVADTEPADGMTESQDARVPEGANDLLRGVGIVISGLGAR